MQSGPLLTVIIPFYNVANYFAQLLDSIDIQLTEAVQVILVCDGATDGSLKLAQQHIDTSTQPQCYQLLLQANAGVSVARNNGIAHATADYIGFIDADDVILPGYFSSLLAVIRQDQPDLIEFGYKRFTEASAIVDTKARYLHRNAGWLQKDKATEEAFKASRWFPWLRVYRKSILPNFQFPAGIAFCEDVMAIPALYLAAQRFYRLRLPLYGYREHNASASFHVTAEHQQQLHDFFTDLKQMRSYPALPEFFRHILLFHLAYLLYKLQLENSNQRNFPAELDQQLKALVRQLWWSPQFSIRKKLNLAFAPYFYRRHCKKTNNKKLRS